MNRDRVAEIKKEAERRAARFKPEIYEMRVRERIVEKERKSRYDEAFDKAVGKRKLDNMGWTVDKVQWFDIYRFIRKYAKVRYSIITNDDDWGPYFNQAVADLKDFVITVYSDPFDDKCFCRIWHKHISKAQRLCDAIEYWILENNVFRAKEFTYPTLEKPEMSSASYISDSTKRIVDENVILFLRKLHQLRRHRLKTKRGILLYGNPGNGKTSICRYVSKSLPSVTRIWVTDWHMGPDSVSEVFEIARDFAPSIIFFEDIDTVGLSHSLTGRINPLLGKLLNEMDGIQENDGVVVVATTNNIYVLDQALANRPGRFDLKINVRNPHPSLVKKITGHEDNITLAEAFRRKRDRIYYEKILGRKYQPPKKHDRVHYIG